MFVEQGDGAQARVRPEILDSWQRSGAAISPEVAEAPMADESDTRSFWQDSPLQTAVARVEAELRRTAEDGDLVVAVTDADTRILWTYGGRVMRRKAETVNFVAGGRWDETSVGTNALDLAARVDAPSMVFSAEHYASIVHNWVCWAAPVHDPVSGEQLGVIDLSTTWDRSHPIGLATARVMARLIETAMPETGRYGNRAAVEAMSVEPGLDLTLLGTAQARVDGHRLLLNRRQTEILALLALHPEGLSSEHLHALLYGDSAVTLSTLKSEVSHLRHALGGQLASRPYRLTMPVRIDVDNVIQLLRRGRVADAVAAYGGDLMPGTDSPALTELADYVAVAVREALLADPQPDAVMRYVEIAPYDTEVVEVCLARLGDTAHPAKALLKGRLAAAGR
ncbi:transcriptional regulator [Nocardioides sp. MJB4]|uniref:Transcriptional regulator n=2 Tax=Nocardioides donggukensis TaxID=2774019 RepID=A0A927K1Y2_9ACTN|nr:transcriptional regulator [Nocardioides donggukensis]